MPDPYDLLCTLSRKARNFSFAQSRILRAQGNCSLSISRPTATSASPGPGTPGIASSSPTRISRNPRMALTIRRSGEVNPRF